MQVFNYARGSRSIARTKEATVISHILLSLVLLCLCLMTEGREHMADPCGQMAELSYAK